MTKTEIILRTIFSIVCVLSIVFLCLLTDDWMTWMRGVGAACWFHILTRQIKCIVEM